MPDLDPIKDIALQHTLKFQEIIIDHRIYDDEEIIEIAKLFYGFLTESEKEKKLEQLNVGHKCKCNPEEEGENIY